VTETLLDPAQLREGLSEAQAEYTRGTDSRAGRLGALDRETATLRGRLSRILDEELDAAAGSETARLLRDKRGQIELSLAQLARERDRLAAEPVDGLSAEQALSLEAFAAEIRAGIEHADEPERHRILQMLHVKAAVKLDEDHGSKLGRDHRYSIAWDAVIPLRHADGTLDKVRAANF
jgi:hypothetical protein